MQKIITRNFARPKAILQLPRTLDRKAPIKRPNFQPDLGTLFPRW